MNNLVEFLGGVKSEFSKVVWPTMSDLVGSTMVVLSLVFAFSLYLGGLDFCFTHLMEKVLSL